MTSTAALLADVMSSIQKPRLEYYRGILSMKNPDIEKIVESFILRSKYVEYIIFRKENLRAMYMSEGLARAEINQNRVKITRKPL